MGLIDNIGYGIGAAADVGSAGLLDQFQALVTQDRETALAQVRAHLGQQTHAANTLSDQQAAEQLRQARAAQVQDIINGKADQAAGAVPAQRMSTPDDVNAQADAAGNAYNDALGKGLISQSDADLAYKAAGDYRKDNSTMVDNTDAQDATRKKVANDPETMAQALDAIGDHEGAYKMRVGLGANQRGDAMMARAEQMLQLQQLRSDTATQIADMKLQAAKEKATDGKVDTATGRMLITSYDADIKAATSMMNMARSQMENTLRKDMPAVQAKIDQYEAEVKEAQANKIGFFKSMGYPAGEFSAPKPAAAPAPAKPFNPADFQKKASSSAGSSGSNGTSEAANY
ncbi:MAG: hypothetical protein M0P95_07160 [Sulfuritalea sp.]|jgi:hypothetical protein|nr:hypothetical protein [Sulfuritalea sp.]